MKMELTATVQLVPVTSKVIPPVKAKMPKINKRKAELKAIRERSRRLRLVPST